MSEIEESIESRALSAVIEDRFRDAQEILKELDTATLATFAKQTHRLTEMTWRVHDEKLRRADVTKGAS